MIQYTLANPNRGVQIFYKSVPISEFVRISEVTLFLWCFREERPNREVGLKRTISLL